MPKVQVLDPAMCCSTGVCGPAIDPVQPRFAADWALAGNAFLVPWPAEAPTGAKALLARCASLVPESIEVND